MAMTVSELMMAYQVMGKATWYARERFWRTLQQIAEANKTSLSPLLFIESQRSWLRGEREQICRVSNGPVRDLPNTESSSSRVREKRGPAE